MGSIGVLGSGISGLSAAYYLQKSCTNNVKLLEASSRVGGWIRSTQYIEDHVFEHGPRTLQPKGTPGANTFELLSDLGLSELIKPIRRDHPASQNRLVYVNKELHILPSNFLSLLIPKPPFSRPIVWALVKDLQTPKLTAEDESIYSFAERRLGKEIADFMISPLICGVCAGDAREISVKFLLKHLFDAEQKHGSIAKGLFNEKFQNRSTTKTQAITNPLSEKSRRERWSVYSLKGGLEVITQTLRKRVVSHGVEILLNEPCKKVTFIDKNKVCVVSTRGEYVFDRMVSALPASKFAPVIEHQHPKLAEELSQIPYVTVGVVNLHFSGQVLARDAFGFLVPPAENIPILGVVFDSCIFPDGKNTQLTVMMGGHWFDKYFGKNPSESMLLDTALKHTKSILGINQDPEHHIVSILRDCIPQYIVGHHSCVKRIKSYIHHHKLPLALCGASYDGVGVNDVIFSSRKAVENILTSL